MSYVGELGWELHHPIEYAAARCTTSLREAGDDLGLIDFGYRALESMRLEKCYRLWGADLSADWSPLQAGLERFVAFDKGDFIGRDALLREREQGSTHALSCLVVDADGVDAHGLEPDLRRRRAADRVRRLGRLRPHDRALDRPRLPPGRARGGRARS